MDGTAAPYLNVPEQPDRPELDLASDIEAAADAVYRCSEAVLRMGAHEAEYCGAEPLLARLRAVVEELRNVTGG
jgi:hypothetical protein